MIVFVRIEDLEIEVPRYLEEVAADDARAIFQHRIAAHLVETPGNETGTDMASDLVARRLKPGCVLAECTVGGKIIR